MMARVTKSHHWLLAAVRRSGHLAIALVSHDKVLEVQRFPARGEQMEAAIKEAVAKVAREYAVFRVAVEPGSLVEVILSGENYQLLPMTLGEAASEILPESPKDQKTIFSSLVTKYPSLARHVTILRGTGAVACASDQRWRNVMLLASLVGLAVSAQRSKNYPISKDIYDDEPKKVEIKGKTPDHNY